MYYRSNRLYIAFVLLSLFWIACSDDDSKGSANAEVNSEAGNESMMEEAGNQVIAGHSTGTNEGMPEDQVTYYQHVRPILEEHCTQCHAPGGVGLFDLTSYESAKMWSAAVVEATQSRRMPPWGAYEADDCTPRFGWKDDHSLTQEELDILVQWREQEEPEGDEAEATPFTPYEVAELARIDFEGSAQIPLAVEPGDDDFICVVIDPKIEEETWIKGIEIVPDNEALVHHVVLFTDPTRASLDLMREDGTYSCFGSAGVPGSIAAAWAPGGQPARYPENHAMRVAPDTLFVMQMHYSPQGGADELSDQTRLRFEYADESPLYEIYLQLMGNFGFSMHPALGIVTDDFFIPAGVESHHEKLRWTYSGQLFSGPMTAGPSGLKEMRLLSVSPHMHYAGVDMKVSLERVLPGEQACESGRLLDLFGCGNEFGCLEQDNPFRCLQRECTTQWDATSVSCWGCAHNVIANTSGGQAELFSEMLKCEQPRAEFTSPLIQSEQPAQECLVSTPNYDFEWQRAYAYDAPLEELPVLSPGDVMTIDCYYNNSMNNRLMREALGRVGLDAPKDVVLGDETLDEMCLIGLLFAFERNEQ